MGRGEAGAGAAEFVGKGARLGLELNGTPSNAHRYVQSLLDIMVFLDKDPEDHRTLSQ